MCENKLHDSLNKYKDSGFSKSKVKMLIKTGDFIFRCCACKKTIDYFEYNGSKSIYFWVDDNLKVSYTRCNQCSNKYQKQYRESSELRKLKHGIRSCISNSMKSKGYTKNTNTYKYLKISYEEFKEHIEKQFTEGMSWDNYGDWEYDHIIPMASAYTEEEVISLNHHLNFQPLWKKDNRDKSDKYTEVDKQAMLTKIRLWKK